MCSCLSMYARCCQNQPHSLQISADLQPQAYTHTDIEWAEENERFYHIQSVSLSPVFLSSPGLCARAPRQDKRDEKTRCSAEEKLLSAQQYQRKSSYLDYRSHNTSLSRPDKALKDSLSQDSCLAQNQYTRVHFRVQGPWLCSVHLNWVIHFP